MMMDKLVGGLRFRTLLLLLAASITILSIFTLLIHHNNNSVSLLRTLFFKQQLQTTLQSQGPGEGGKDHNIIVNHSPGESGLSIYNLSIHYNKSLIYLFMFLTFYFSLLFLLSDQNAIIMSGGSKRNFQLQPPQTTNTSQTVSDIIIIG
jgi:hypothetical protein